MLTARSLTLGVLRRRAGVGVIDPQPDLELTTPEAERLLHTWLGRPVVCSQILPLKGGLVNSVFRLDFDRPPHHAVVKLHGSGGDTFVAEALALEHLRAETACPVPSVYLQDNSARLIPHAFLLIEHVPGVSLNSLDLAPIDRADIDAQLADVLGELHNHKRRSFGRIDTDEAVTWADVFVARLLGARTQPAVSERLTPDVLTRVDEAVDLARAALRDAGTPTLVHGDVWDGNVMVNLEGGRWRLAGLLDPDLQFADVELELAYLEVFDVSRKAFFAGYARHQALRPGYERRRLFYWLHTALVHVALFGDDFFCQFTARTAERIGRLEMP